MFQQRKKKDLVSTKKKKGHVSTKKKTDLVSTKKQGRALAICKDFLCFVCTNICLASHSSKKGLQRLQITIKTNLRGSHFLEKGSVLADCSQLVEEWGWQSSEMWLVSKISWLVWAECCQLAEMRMTWIEVEMRMTEFWEVNCDWSAGTNFQCWLMIMGEDVLEEVVGHHYENENDNDKENGASPLNSAWTWY